MKIIIKFLFQVIISLWSFVYPYSLNVRLLYFKDKLYSIWVSKSLPKIGGGNFFKSPVRITGGRNMNIGAGNSFGEHCMLSTWEKYKGYAYAPSLVIGNECSFGFCNHISCCNSISIGNGVLTGMYVLISDNNHGEIIREELDTPPLYRPLTSKGSVVIHDNVWIGDKVAILGRVHIGR